MWFSPGMIAGAILAVVVYEVTGKASQWWLWVAAVILSIVVDILLRVKRTVVPNLPHRSAFVIDKKDKA